MCEILSKRGGNKMLDVSMMTIEQFERLLDKPMMSMGIFSVEKQGRKIVLGNWVNRYCLGALLGRAYEDYLVWFLGASLSTKTLEDVKIEEKIKNSLDTYISNKIGQIDKLEYLRVLSSLLSIKSSLLQLMVLRANVKLPIFEVFHKIINIDSLGMAR